MAIVCVGLALLIAALLIALIAEEADQARKKRKF
jgi:hypothetical protein